MKVFRVDEPLTLECGAVLHQVQIAYHTYGQLNHSRDNVIWICHALTANSNVEEWWQGLFGNGRSFDPEKYFIVCANILGSAYGTTGPLSANPKTQQPYYSDFPLITIRDMVNAHQLLCRHLEITSIQLLVGGSMGGYQALEWCVLEPSLINKLFLIATSPKETAWGIAIHTAQRLAIEADCTWGSAADDAGAKGLKAARAIGMITYRNYSRYVSTQTDSENGKLDHFRASSYIEYQGEKLVKRFNAYSYWYLTKAMDSFDISRGRNQSVQQVLNSIRQKTLVIGITSDLLCPLAEQQLLASNIPASTFVQIDSDFGHDGFLTETQKISEALSGWMS